MASCTEPTTNPPILQRVNHQLPPPPASGTWRIRTSEAVTPTSLANWRIRPLCQCSVMPVFSYGTPGRDAVFMRTSTILRLLPVSGSRWSFSSFWRSVVSFKFLPRIMHKSCDTDQSFFGAYVGVCIATPVMFPEPSALLPCHFPQCNSYGVLCQSVRF